MDEFKRIQKSSLLILLLQFTGAAIGQRDLYLSVRVGDEATLPCNNVFNDQDQCESTTWLLSYSGSTAVLVRGGQIGEEARAKSDRLRVTEKCSLVVKKVTEEDAGPFTCRQFRSGEQQGSDSLVLLSVVTMTEHQNNDEVTLLCSVTTRVGCRHKVKWLLQGRDVDEDNKDIKTSASDCNASVTFPTSHYGYRQRSELFTCSVTADGYNVQTFSFQSSDGDDQAATTTTNTSGRINNQVWWLYLVVALVLVALLITIVAFITWRKMKGKEARESDSVGQTSNPVNSPETNPATADHEEGVCYASISYTKNTHKNAEVKIETDEGDEVTYSTVKASTNEPSSLYDTI
ncbi:uncharacterized protein LOC117541260 isoform X1 [Gymnodraco acuticeps]|uniref:Uncharacterized protein LOC117541260 isoform X1 n=1 Tax=Gymnodraco acuticeps TaxID=8218 RepID=A0A6P8U058_GYMAC|nr:uncharacterized protein LOC117541260 isoform X1 [Gymnodraco acuticeps]